MGKKIRITKCYLIEVVDENDKELVSDFFFGKLADAKKEGEIIKNKGYINFTVFREKTQTLFS